MTRYLAVVYEITTSICYIDAPDENVVEEMIRSDGAKDEPWLMLQPVTVIQVNRSDEVLDEE